MDLRQLEYFQMVSRLNSITKAAEALHVAQPSITIAIQKLEEELGVKLFDRSQRKISLTTEGRVFHSRIDDILSRVQDSISEMNDYKLSHKGTIRIGIPPMIGAFLLPNIYANLKKHYPNYQLLAIEEGTLTIRSLLERGELDLGLIIISNLGTSLEGAPITSDQIVACLPTDHPLSTLSSISFTELGSQPLIMLKEDSYNRQLIMEGCRKQEITPHVVYTSSQIQTIMGLVEKGVGIAFLFQSLIRDYSGIISRPLADPHYITIGLAWNKDRYLSRAARSFVDLIANPPSPYTSIL